MINADFHIHSSFSDDSDEKMEDMILEGIRQKLQYMCFTEHMDYDFPVNPKDPEYTFIVDTPAYQDECLRLAAQYSSKINVRFGIELGLQEHLAEKHLSYVNQFPFDFVIGSVHICNRKDPYYSEFYEGRTEREAYTEYFQSVLSNIQAYNDYDILGHMDYVVRYGPNRNANYSYAAYSDIIDEILRTVIDKGHGIEMNVSGFAAGLGHPNPCEDVIKRYRELGGKIITVGSDSHDVGHLRNDRVMSTHVLEACGFKYYTIFKNRQPEFITL